MRRRWLILAVVLAAAAGAGPAAARDVASTPERTVRAFVAALHAPFGERSPCGWLSARLRAPLAMPGSLGRDPRFPDSYDAAGEVRACDALVAYGQGLGDAGRWRATRLVSLRFVARHGRRAHLRAVIERRLARSTPPRPARADVFLLREQGIWRIVSPSRLWELGFDDGAPRSFAALRQHLRWLARVGGEADAEARRLVRGYLATRVPIATALPPSGSAISVVSETRDRLRDVSAGSGRADQARATVDLRGATLTTDGATVTFELRFGGPAPTEAQIELSARQGREVPGTTRDRELREMTWTATVHDGWASAYAGDVEEPRPLHGIAAAAAGDTLRLRFPLAALARAGRLGGTVALARPFRWGLTAFEIVERGRDLPAAWADVLPDGSDLDSRAGVLHRP